jgi:hypothetical protein
VNVAVVVLFGRPLKTPVELFKEAQAGNAPETTVKECGAAPPEAVNVWL